MNRKVRSHDLSRDRAYLAHPEAWTFGRVCMKTHGVEPQRFGVIFDEWPLNIYLRFVVGDGPITGREPETFKSIDEMLKNWMVD